MTAPLISGLKDVLRPTAHGIEKLLRVPRGKLALKLVHRHLRRQHPSLITTIHPRDEMLLFGINALNDPNRSRALYFQTGEGMLRNLSNVLRGAGRDLRDVT